MFSSRVLSVILTAERSFHFQLRRDNPNRYYLGVRLMVAMYLYRFPEESDKFKNLDSRILDDAHTRAINLLSGGASGDYLGMRFQTDRNAQRLAVCWSGNPAACIN